MKVLLISANLARSPYPVFPIGMGMVDAALRAAGHEVERFDSLQAGGSLDRLRDALRETSPALVGISVRNIDNVNAAHEQRYIDGVADIVRTVKSVCSAPVVLGGSGFSLMPEEILAATGGDFGIVGEGEAAFRDFVAQAERGVFPRETILRAPPGLQGEQIPSAYYDPELLGYYLENGRMASIQTKRGCNKRCVYCSYPVLEGGDVRMREPSAVVDDIERLVGDHAAGYLFFVDSVFNDSTGRYRELIREMHRRRVKIPWTAFFTPDGGLDDATIELMTSTGLHAAEIGADAATDATLKAMGKDFTFADVAAFNERMLRHGVTTAHYYMFGGPGETPATVDEGIDNIRNLRQTANFMFAGIRILPHTPLMRLAQREGLIEEGRAMLTPVYYVSPAVDRDWLEKTLSERFADRADCVFPPDALDDKLHILHRLGYSGSMYDFLIKKRPKR